jgi:hypothetical protein
MARVAGAERLDLRHQLIEIVQPADRKGAAVDLLYCRLSEIARSKVQADGEDRRSARERSVASDGLARLQDSSNVRMT